MQISTKDWKNYIDKLTKLNTTAGKLISDYVARNGFGNTDAILDYAYALVTKYGEGSAALSAEMYDTIAEMSGMMLPPAEVAPTADYGEVAKAVQGTIKKSKNPNTTGGTISRLVKQAGADTMLKNAGRDHAQFAWVPMGDTCAFCMTLASRGWQYISAKSMRNGHAEHIHANCDCNYMVRFDDKSGVKGYDPEYYLSMYEEAEGSNSKEKINSMRRMRYAERKDVINAQKRAAYAEKNDKDAVRIDIDKTFNEKSRERIQSIINRLTKEYNSPINRIVKSTKSSAGEQGFVGIGERNIIQLGSTKPETLIHEFAHTLAISKEDKLGLTNNDEFWKEIRSIKRDYDKELVKNISKKISSYASENIDEFFAEAFMQAKAHQMGIQLSWGVGDDLTYANRVISVVDKYFGKLETYRKVKNSGIYSIYEEPMSKKHVHNVVSEMGLNPKGAKYVIDLNPELVGKNVYGHTSQDGKVITLYPSAFTNREQLVKTIGHENIHLKQAKKNGKIKTHLELVERENEALASEEEWWNSYVKNTGYRRKNRKMDTSI